MVGAGDGLPGLLDEVLAVGQPGEVVGLRHPLALAADALALNWMASSGTTVSRMAIGNLSITTMTSGARAYCAAETVSWNGSSSKIARTVPLPSASVTAMPTSRVLATKQATATSRITSRPCAV